MHTWRGDHHVHIHGQGCVVGERKNVEQQTKRDEFLFDKSWDVFVEGTGTPRDPRYLLIHDVKELTDELVFDRNEKGFADIRKTSGVVRRKKNVQPDPAAPWGLPRQISSGVFTEDPKLTTAGVLRSDQEPILINHTEPGQGNYTGQGVALFIKHGVNAEIIFEATGDTTNLTVVLDFKLAPDKNYMVQFPGGLLRTKASRHLVFDGVNINCRVPPVIPEIDNRREVRAMYEEMSLQGVVGLEPEMLRSRSTMTDDFVEYSAAPRNQPYFLKRLYNLEKIFS